MRLRLYLDELPSSGQKNAIFKQHLAALEQSFHFRCGGIMVPEDQIAEVNSHGHLPLQCLDVVLGAMQFRLNELHERTVDGGIVRGRKTIAKEALYHHIHERIRQIHPAFEVGATTARPGGDRDGWHHPCRHWLFMPRRARIDESLTMPKKDSAPPPLAS